jgi:RNA-directed DNA polymerase
VRARTAKEQSERGAAIITNVYDPVTRRDLAQELAGAFLSGRWDAEGVAERGAGCLDRWPPWMSVLGFRVVAAHRSAPIDRREELVSFIESFLAQPPGTQAEAGPPQIIRLLTDTRPPFTPDWPVATIDSVAALAERLELSDGQLAWLADVRALERTVTANKLRNYRYRTLPRRSGLPRVIESPKARLKEIQRWVLHEILDRVPTHDAAHGFVRGRSVISHAQLHTRQRVVVRLDLADFFASITAARVYGLFLTMGYPPAVAHTLTGLCTNAVPLVLWQQIRRPATPALVAAHFWLGRQLAAPHLPQGAPTSPALANLAAFRMDRRLAGLAASWGLRYSRYADDLVFSGRRVMRASALHRAAAAIAADEGFAVNEDKSSVRTAATRQLVCGVVVNAHPNVTRAEYDRLKAILHNAARDGPGVQNVGELRAQLQGRIAWIASLNPRRGEKLRRRFSEIDWRDGAD